MSNEVKDKKVYIEVKNLKKYFKVGRHATLKAVDNVSFDIYKGETLGIVGESGCGKTTCGRTIMGLYEATDGQVLYDGVDLHSIKGEERKKFTRKVQIIFQDPYASLDPRMTVGEIIGEGIDIHKIYNKEKKQARIYELLELVGLNAEHASRFPHEFSGGQRQRIGIARALALNPSFIVADEPVSALDVSIQSQIVNLMMDLQEEMGFSYLFISHDLSIVKHICHKIGVMYLGSLVELAPKNELYENPLHPYTKALLSAVPIPDPTIKRERIILRGDIPSPANPPTGCKFHTRCPYAMDKCKKEIPEYKCVGKDHYVACHLVE